MDKRNGLTLSIIFQAESANYGEGYRNLTVLKKMSRNDYQEYTYISRQALRYNIVEQLGWNNTPVEAQGGNGSQVVQFSPETTIVDYPEIDLFGYMKTTSKKEGDATSRGGASTRSAVARLSNAVSLEPFKGDMDYLTNMGLANRDNLSNAIAQSEIHHSYYGYTITIDLDLVGKDGTLEIVNEEKANRVTALLDALEFLYRDIKGRRENLAPLFVVGGLYERKNPYFLHRLKIQKNQIVTSTIKDIFEIADVKDNTRMGLLEGIFDNEKELKENFNVTSVHEAFQQIKQEVYEYYR